MRLVDANLEQTYVSARETNRRAAAEIAFALGLRCKMAGDYVGMNRYREESIRLFREVGVLTLEDAAPVYESINDIQMPELIHEDVVAAYLAHS